MVFTPYQEIIEGTIKAYVADTRLPSFLVPPPFRLRDVLRNQTAKTIANLRELAVESQQAIDKRTRESEAFFLNLWPLIKQEKAKGTQESFEDYWNHHALYLVEKFADLHGLLAECQAKGSLGLLDHIAMKTMAVGILSQGYANLYEKTTIARGDFPDLQHAVFASAIGTLVTHDDRFTKVMKRIPIDGLEILDIHSLLSQL